jgi:hypothetical protein
MLRESSLVEKIILLIVPFSLLISPFTIFSDLQYLNFVTSPSGLVAVLY